MLPFRGCSPETYRFPLPLVDPLINTKSSAWCRRNRRHRRSTQSDSALQRRPSAKSLLSTPPQRQPFVSMALLLLLALASNKGPPSQWRTVQATMKTMGSGTSAAAMLCRRCRKGRSLTSSAMPNTRSAPQQFRQRSALAVPLLRLPSPAALRSQRNRRFPPFPPLLKGPHNRQQKHP